MVIKGKSVAGATRLAKHLERVDTNERMEVKELRSVAADDLHGALREMDAVATACPRCQKPFYHASINTLAKDRLTDEQRFHAIDRLERELGFTGQPRVVVVHEKEGREHCHIVWSRIDAENMRTISDSHNYRKHEIVARELEREFGHERVQGAHIERDGKPRPERTPSHEEMQQAERGAVKPAEAKAIITDLWQRTDSGQAFKSALEEREWLLAQGDRRDFVAIDPAGGTHSLARRVDGAKAQDIRERMRDVDALQLPSVAEAKLLQQERQAERAQGAGERPQPAELPPVEQAPATPEERAQPVPEPAPAYSAAPFYREAVVSFGDGAMMGAPMAEKGSPAAEKGLLMVADASGKAAETLADFVGGLTDMFSGSAPPKQYSAAELARDAGARREHYQQQAAARAGDEALDRLREDMAAGKGLEPVMVRALTQDQLLGIKAHGDAYLIKLIEQREREERAKGSERERDR